MKKDNSKKNNSLESYTPSDPRRGQIFESGKQEFTKNKGNAYTPASKQKFTDKPEKVTRKKPK